MSRASGRVARRWSGEKVSRENKDSSSTGEYSSQSDEDVAHPKDTSTPVKLGRSDSEETSEAPENRRESTEDTEESSVEVQKIQRRGDHVSRKKCNRKSTERQRGGHDIRRKRKEERRSEDSEHDEEDGASSSSSSSKRNSEENKPHSKRKRRNFKEEDELPITEILRRTQETARTKYEQQPHFPELTTDKVYVPHRGGFSTIKINHLRELQKKKIEETEGSVKFQRSPPIRVAIAVQKFWKMTGQIFQGILGGMALMHFIMLQVFFNASVEFVAQYSAICEIYTNIFSFLVALCIVSTFDKFDLARLNIEHLREMCIDYSWTIIAVPLYLIIFCLHQVCSETDSQLSLAYYRNSNNSFWENATEVQTLLNDLDSWEKMSISKDILAVFAWLFVSLGTKDDAFLIYLQSMEKYADDLESTRQ